MSVKTAHIAAMATGLLIAATASAEAGGFYLNERSVKASGRAFAGAAAMPDDVTAMSFNPAALTALPRAEVAVGIYGIKPHASLTDGGSTADIGPYSGIPTGGRAEDQGFDLQPSGYFYAAAPLSQDIWLGLSVTAPFGLKDEYKADYFGRYDSTRSEVMVIDIAPTLAWRLADTVSVGGSLSIQRASAKLDSALPNPFDPAVPNAASDGSFKVDGDDWSIGYTVGILFRPRADLRLGVSYRGAVDHRLGGKAVTDFLGSVTRQDLEVDLKLPDVISLAMAFDATDNLTLLASVTHFGWNRFKEIRLELDDGSDLASAENFRNTWSVAVGAEMRLSDRWALRGGVEYDETPTVDAVRSTRLPDANRLWAAVGATWTLSDRFSLDASYMHMFRKNTAINRVTALPQLATSIHTIGTSRTSSNVIGLGLVCGF